MNRETIAENEAETPDRGRKYFAVPMMMAAVFGTLVSGCVKPEHSTGKDHTMLENLAVRVDERAPVIVKTIHAEYPNNRYVSLRDFAFAMRGTPKRFHACISRAEAVIETGKDYVACSGEGLPFPENSEEQIWHTDALAKIPLFKDGERLYYATYAGTNTEGEADRFIRLSDLVMQLDLQAEFSENGIRIDTLKPYRLSEASLKNPSFFQGVHAAILGDAQSGEVWLSHRAHVPFAIASITKLMTFLVLADAFREGRISRSDTVIVPSEVSLLSKSPDGVIAMESGQKADIEDLLKGMLLPSSNECSLALAIHAEGSEEAFVQKMNEKAEEIGLCDQPVFYNCHGLPGFTDDLAACKVQNQMSASDMFHLIRVLIHTCPEVLEITSLKSAFLSSLHADVTNTNPLLFHVPGVIGMKTGTTDMAGHCLAALLKTRDRSGKDRLITMVEFGADSDEIRVTFSEQLIRYGKQIVTEEQKPLSAR